MKHYLWACLGLVIANPAEAADWKYLTRSSSGAVVYVDVESIRALDPISVYRPFPARQVWVKVDYSEDRTVSYREKRTLERFNCDAETSFTVSGITYSPAGSVVDSYTEREFEFKYEPAAPGTVGYAIMEYACGRISLP